MADFTIGVARCPREGATVYATDLAKALSMHLPAEPMTPLALRLRPQQDLRLALEEALGLAHCEAAFVLSGMGSLSGAKLRFAGQQAVTAIDGAIELLSLSGSLSAQRSHLHASVANAQGQVFGGHVAPGNLVRTTAEILLVLLPARRLLRQTDPQTGEEELVIAPRVLPER